jgi:hypothetical protein
MRGRLTLVTILAALGALTERVGLLVLVSLLQVVGIDVRQSAIGQVAQSVRDIFG